MRCADSSAENARKSGLLPFFYEDPTETVDAEDLRKVSLKRYDLLKKLEIHHISKNYRLDDPPDLITLEHGQGLYRADPNGAQNDALSHFVLKHMFKANNEKCSWWVKYEGLLFRYRVIKYGLSPENMLSNKLKGFQKVNSSEIPVLSPDDRRFFTENTVYYKVPLSHGLPLLKKGYFPIKGCCYIKSEDLITIVSNLFIAGLELNLQEARAVSINNERLLEVLQLLSDSQNTSSYEPKLQGSVTLATLPSLAESHLPPCMKKLFFRLKAENHLKHYGRLQLGLFLKGLGLSLEDCLLFWRTEFCRKITADKFVKDYQYGIMHSHGKAGKMADYRPWSCGKIVNLPQPAESEHHGCPFRHSAKGELLQLLSTYNTTGDLKEALAKKHPNEPQASCLLLFQATHPTASNEVLSNIGMHPNAFTDSSLKCL